MQAASQSFEIRTAEDYLRELVHGSYNDFRRNTLSSRDAIVCATFTWHMHEWVWHQHRQVISNHTSPGKYALELRTKYAQFKVLAGVANGSKHCVRNQNQKENELDSTELVHGFWTGIGFFTQSHLTVRMNGKIFFMDHVLRFCVDYWNSFFTNHLGIVVALPEIE